MTEAIFDFSAIARINRRESAVSKVEESHIGMQSCDAAPDVLEAVQDAVRSKRDRLFREYGEGGLDLFEVQLSGFFEEPRRGEMYLCKTAS